MTVFELNRFLRSFLFLFVIINSGNGNSDRGTSTTDNCIRLPLSSSFFSTELKAEQDKNGKKFLTQNEKKLEEIVLGGLEQLDFDNLDKTAVLLLGDGGSGKIMSQLINGDLRSMFAVKTSTGDLTIINEEGRVKSEKFIPEYTKNPNNSQTFYDCSGFEDYENRQQKVEIVALYFLKKVTDHINKVKFIFTLPQSSLTLGSSNNFDYLAKLAQSLVWNWEKVGDSIGLIVTDVPNDDEENGEILHQKYIKEKIVKFLNEQKTALGEKLKLNTIDENEKEIEDIQGKIQFISALLKQNQSGDYSKIGFVPSPNLCGQLSKLGNFYHARGQIVELINNILEYAEVKPEDFGFIPLKDETRLEVKNKFIPEIKNSLIVSTTTALETLWEDYENNFYANYSRPGDEQVKAVKKLQSIYNHLLNPQENISVTEELRQIFKLLGTSPQKIPEYNLKGTQGMEDLLKFLRTLTMNVEDADADYRNHVEFPEMQEMFANFSTKFGEFVDIEKNAILSEVLPETKSKIERNLRTLLHKMNQIFDGIRWKATFQRNWPLWKSLQQNYEKIAKFGENEQSANLSASSHLENLRMSLTLLQNRYPEQSDEDALKRLRENEKRLQEIASLSEIPEISHNFHPSSSSLFFQEFSKIFSTTFYNSWDNKFRQHVIEHLLREIVSKKELQSRKILSLYEKVIKEKIDHDLNQCEHYAVAAAIEILEHDHEQVETELNETATETTYNSLRTEMSELDDFYFNLKLLKNHTIPLQENYSESAWTVLKMFEIEIQAYKSQGIITSPKNYFLLNFNLMRDNIHSLIRRNLIPNVENSMNSLTTNILEQLSTEYFNTVENRFTDNTNAVAKREFFLLFKSDCKILKNKDELRVEEIFAVLGNSTVPQNYTNEMMEKNSWLSFLQDVVVIKNVSRHNSTISNVISESAKTFVRKTAEKCDETETQVLENIVRQTTLEIEATTQSALRNLRISYFAWLDKTLRLSSGLQTYKQFLSDFKNLAQVYKNIYYNNIHPNSLAATLDRLNETIYHVPANASATEKQERDKIPQLIEELNYYISFSPPPPSLATNYSNLDAWPSFWTDFLSEIYQPFQDKNVEISGEIWGPQISKLLKDIESVTSQSVDEFLTGYEIHLNKIIEMENSRLEGIKNFQRDLIAMEAWTSAILGTSSQNIASQLYQLYTLTASFNSGEMSRGLEFLSDLAALEYSLKNRMGESEATLTQDMSIFVFVPVSFKIHQRFLKIRENIYGQIRNEFLSTALKNVERKSMEVVTIVTKSYVKTLHKRLSQMQDIPEIFSKLLKLLQSVKNVSHDDRILPSNVVISNVLNYPSFPNLHQPLELLRQEENVVTFYSSIVRGTMEEDLWILSENLMQRLKHLSIWYAYLILLRENLHENNFSRLRGFGGCSGWRDIHTARDALEHLKLFMMIPRDITEVIEIGTLTEPDIQQSASVVKEACRKLEFL